MSIIYSIIAVIVVSVISLIGIIFILVKEAVLRKILLFLVSFSAGSLLSAAFVHLIPEAYEKFGNTPLISVFIISGILIFFVLEKFLRWRHCHIPTSKAHPHPIAFLNLIGDTVHNFIDGLLIGGSFLVSNKIGLATTIAVVLHEIPQEIGDFGVLLYGNFSIRKALAVNFLSALAAVLGTVVSLIVGNIVIEYAYYLMPIAAGGFVYVAGTDLIPELHHVTDLKKSFGQLMFLILGIILLIALNILIH
ncbi:MAG: ZIP family metal transporter [candidate division WOR-3 bacterium]|nr:ZIP family metal transporter [candidate division WOR-3 bacterium]MCX7757014.1 ZIP family metal transporter [candidate division WOR-3 bacterium]MDW7987318.1 ZIP family metal transporter [candidate division WOR-3 bacterium]